MLIENAFAGNNNVCYICRHFKDSLSRNVRDFDVLNGPMSNLNMFVESPYATLYLMAIGMFAIEIKSALPIFAFSQHPVSRSVCL